MAIPLRAAASGRCAAAVAAVPFLLATASAVPVFDGTYDWEGEVDLGLDSPQATVTAPFNLNGREAGVGGLNFIEFNATNGAPFSAFVATWEAYDENASAARSHPLARAENVTYLLFAFSTLEIITTPAPNHTAESDVAANFASVVQPVTAGHFAVVLERREAGSAHVVVRLDRSPVGVGAPGPRLLDGGFAPGVLVALAAGAFGLSRERGTLAPPRRLR